MHGTKFVAHENMKMEGISTLIAIALFLLFVNDVVNSLSCSKQYRLRLVISNNMVTMSNIVVKTEQIVANLVNSRCDLLPDYFLELEIIDEKSFGNNAPTALLNFYRNIENLNGTYVSPIMLGPHNSNGCKGIGNFLKLIGFISVSPLCTASILADHIRYPNTYLIMQISPPKNYGYVQFVKEIGRWRKIGLITNAGSSADFSAALHFNKVAIEQGIQIAVFTSVLTVDLELALSLKQSGVRIFVVAVSTRSIVLPFYCLTYQVGIRGPRFLFLTYDNAFPNPIVTADSEYPAGCNRSHVASQIRSTFWMMDSDGGADPAQPSSLGWNSSQLDEAIFAYQNSTQRGSDWDFRNPVYDSLQHIILALNQTENRLKAENLSLRDFAVNTRRVMEVANETVASIEYRGLRVSRFRYDTRGQLSGMPTIISYWTPESLFRRVVMLNQREGTEVYNYSSYDVQYQMPPDNLPWITANRKPPKDSPNLVELVIEPSEEVFVAVSVISAIFLAAKIFCVICIIRMRHDPRLHDQMAKLKLVALCGCVMLDVDVVVFIIRNSRLFPENAESLWKFRIALLELGMTCIHASSACRMVFGYIAVTAAWKNSACHISRRPSVPGTGQSRSKPSVTIILTRISADRSSSEIRPAISPDYEKAERNGIFICYLVIVPVVSLILGLCLGTANPMTCHQSELKAYSYYSNEDDTDYIAKAMTCSSPHQLTWMFSLAGLHFILLGTASVLAFKFRQAKLNGNLSEFKALAVEIINSATLLVAAVFVLVAVSARIDRQQIAVSAFALIQSFVTTITSSFFTLKYSFATDMTT